MPVGLWNVFQGYMPPATWPSPQKLIRVGAWGGVVAVAGLWLVQPFDWIQENMGLKESDSK